MRGTGKSGTKKTLSDTDEVPQEKNPTANTEFNISS